MKVNVPSPWLHRFSVLTAFCTLFLICVGGIVTSKGVGMAVPDWPNTYGYNMFLFPFSKWVGGIFYEHTHRLVASGVGLMTTVLAAWIWLSEKRRWLRVLGIVAFFAVILQGVLGGLRVVLIKDELGIFHGTLAHLFFCLLVLISLFTSRWWTSGKVFGSLETLLNLRRRIVIALCLIFGQLVLGATMRHQHAGLAIADFPLAYGQWYPGTAAEDVARYNNSRLESVALNPITAFQIHLQMAHRFGAVLTAVAVVLCWRMARSNLSEVIIIQRFAIILVGLVLAQFCLGALTVWSGKSADVATAHVAVGATTLAVGSLFLGVVSRLCWARVHETESLPEPKTASLLACSA